MFRVNYIFIPSQQLQTKVKEDDVWDEVVRRYLYIP